MLKNVKIDPAYADLYRDVLQAEINSILSGSTSYGLVVDDEDAVQALQDLVNRLDDVVRANR